MRQETQFRFKNNFSPGAILETTSSSIPGCQQLSMQGSVGNNLPSFQNSSITRLKFLTTVAHFELVIVHGPIRSRFPYKLARFNEILSRPRLNSLHLIIVRWFSSLFWLPFLGVWGISKAR